LRRRGLVPAYQIERQVTQACEQVEHTSEAPLAERRRERAMPHRTSGDASERCTNHSRSGMPMANSAPVIRWRMETIAGSGWRIAIRLR
jgi:hypothetical protein